MHRRHHRTRRTLDLGIAIAATVPTTDVLPLARAADERDLAAVVLLGPREDDAWSTAVFVLGRTERVGVGVVESAVVVPDPADPEHLLPTVRAHGRAAADALAPGRLLPDGAWTLAPEGADAATLNDLAGDGRLVVVPVSSPDDVERVAALAARHATSPTTRSAAVRARRSPGIAYDDVPPGLAAVEPGDPAYGAHAHTYMRGGSPGLVLRPTTPAQVADALALAARHRDLPLGVRSGGHGISGRSTNAGGLVIDVGAMDAIEVLDVDRRLVRVGPGATWTQVATAIAPYGWAISSGDYGGVGVGGLATAGGIGMLGRAHGLTIDHVRAVELVLADGTPVRADADQHPDLFWGVRGAGANLGVATAFELEAAAVGPVGWAQLVVVVDDIEEALLAALHLTTEAPRDTTMFVLTGPPRGGRWALRFYGVVDADDPDVVVERLTPFAQLGALVQQEVRIVPYAVAMAAPEVGPGGHHGAGEPVARTGFATTVTADLARDMVGLLRSGRTFFFQWRTMGGAIADVDPGATAFAHRDALLAVSAMGSDEAALSQAWAPLRRHLDGLYLSFETDRDPARLADAFPPATLARLRELKRRYDPTGLLADNFPIDPSLTDPVPEATTTREDVA